MPREFSDPYVYPGTQVLKNKPGIRSEQGLAVYEYEQTAFRIDELREKPIAGRFDLNHLKAIHKHLFQDVYAWAGEVRSVLITKGGSQFAAPAFIEGYAGTLAAALAKENHLKGLEKSAFVDGLARHFSEFNAVHPFREGNGRATREFFGQLARNAAYELNQTQIDQRKAEWNAASARSFGGDLEPLKAIFSDAIRPAKAVSFDVDKPDDALRKHPELRSAFLTIKAAEAYVASIPGEARKPFLDQIRARVRKTLDEGKDMPMPPVRERDAGRER